jgi:glycosyltransferase involved in cell wall biosynthesis
MPILYRLSDAYILSSLSEQFPISMLEAFASEIPVLCSDIGGISEVVLDSINGYLVNANDPQALADKAYHILLDPDEIRVIVKKAKLLALRKYSIANTAEQYIDLFKTLLRIKR